MQPTRGGIVSHNVQDTSSLVSVIIPSYNSANTILETLDSVFSQTYSNLEVIVVDDNSNDDSVSLIEQHFPHTIIITKKDGDKGVSATRNLGIQSASGKYIAFLDADDIWLPSKIEKQMEALDGHRWSYCNSYYFGYNQDGNTTRSDLSQLYDGDIFDKLLLDNFLTTSTIIIEKSLIEACGNFDESFKILEDWKLWLDVAKKEPISYISEPLATYRVTPGSTSRNAREVYPYHSSLIEHSFHNTPSKFKSLKRTALSNSNTICSYIAEDNKDWGYAMVCSLRAISFDPKKIQSYKRPLSVIYNMVLNLKA